MEVVVNPILPDVFTYFECSQSPGELQLVTAGSVASIPQTTLGQISVTGGTWRAHLLIGRRTAAEMIIAVGVIDAQETCNLGLVDQRCDPEEDL